MNFKKRMTIFVETKIFCSITSFILSRFPSSNRKQCDVFESDCLNFWKRTRAISPFLTIYCFQIKKFMKKVEKKFMDVSFDPEMDSIVLITELIMFSIRSSCQASMYLFHGNHSSLNGFKWFQNFWSGNMSTGWIIEDVWDCQWCWYIEWKCT